MKNKKINWPLFASLLCCIVVVVSVSGCIMAITIQKDNTNSTIDLRNPTEVSADSSKLNIQLPIQY